MEAMRFGSQTYVNNVLQFLNLRVDIFILAAFVGASAEVGHYAVAATVATTLWMIPWAVSTRAAARASPRSRGEAQDDQRGSRARRCATPWPSWSSARSR